MTRQDNLQRLLQNLLQRRKLPRQSTLTEILRASLTDVSNQAQRGPGRFLHQSALFHLIQNAFAETKKGSQRERRISQYSQILADLMQKLFADISTKAQYMPGAVGHRQVLNDAMQKELKGIEQVYGDFGSQRYMQVLSTLIQQSFADTSLQAQNLPGNPRCTAALKDLLITSIQ